MLNVAFMLFMSVVMHPLHLGVVHLNVEHNTEVDIVIRLFSDDLRAALRGGECDGSMFNCADSVSVSDAKNYINKHFKITQASDVSVMEFVHVKPVEDATEFQYRVKLSDVKEVEVCCTFFLDHFSDQTNLLLVKTPSMEEGFRLMSHNTCVHVKI